ncbi:MAG: hypothetical protein AB7L84_03965 [Acidimicrobiia bacterium]
MTPSTPAEPPVRGERAGRLGRVLAVVAVGSMVALWGYVLFLAVGQGRKPPPDTLSDPSFGRAAEVRCQATLDQVAALAPADSAASPQDRAVVIDDATDLFTSMVDDLAAMAPPGPDGELVTLWVADWRTYLDDRREHTGALSTGEDRRFRVSARDGDHITKYLDAFAADNHMPACGSPLDV